MEPRRRRETPAPFTSLQLQRASDQLQEAIQSARRGRSTLGGASSSHATSLSLASDLSSSSSGEEDNDDDDAEEADANEENQPHAANRPRDLEQAVEKPSPEQKLRRFMTNESLGASGRRMSLQDLLASPLRPAREETTANEAPTLKLQLAGEAAALSGLAGSHEEAASLAVRKKLFRVDAVENEARRALDVVQRDVEAQARANRAMQEQLKRAIDQIHKFAEQTVGHSVDTVLVDGKTLEAAPLEKLCGRWARELHTWRDEVHRTKARHDDQVAALEEEIDRRIQEVEQQKGLEREALEARILEKTQHAETLHDAFESMKRVHVDESEQLRAHLRSNQLALERLRMENEDLRGHKLRPAPSETRGESMPSAETTQQRHVLDLLSELKQSELRELQWEMLFEEQTLAARQAQERLDMLLEDVNRTRIPNAKAAADDHASDGGSRFERRTSVASSATSSELHIYQQRIELLEEQLRDVKEQIHCDHHQFLYEQQKWNLEKKHLGQDVEEVHNVSVRVLKLLLIREKLLKKQEKKARRRREQLECDERRLRERQESMHTCLEHALQECGVALLFVRQLAMAGVPDSQCSATLPVKPIKLVRVLKRLKALQQEVASATMNGSRQGHQSPTTSSSSACTSGVGSSARGHVRTA